MGEIGGPEKKLKRKIKFSKTSEIPEDVNRWLRISTVLSLLMGAAYLVACIRNTFTSNLTGHEPLELFLLFSPVIVRATYFNTKDYLEAGQDRLEALGGLPFVNNYDDFLILVVKLFLLNSTWFLIEEVMGYTVWHLILERSWSAVLQISNMLIG